VLWQLPRQEAVNHVLDLRFGHLSLQTKTPACRSQPAAG
jgi:hypothetical protein